MKALVFGSVCSGIESAGAAWNHLGFQAAFLSEIDPFARAVLTYRFPTAPLHDDFTTIDRGDYAAVDVLVGGTPCQSFSVAGRGGGLDDDRGRLTLEFGSLANRLRPCWIVWENVPGVLSAEGGRAFGAFLGTLAHFGYGFAYRVLDAQGFGVPQRRRRVFVVAHLGDWRPAAAVLFEPGCGGGGSFSSGSAWKAASSTRPFGADARGATSSIVIAKSEPVIAFSAGNSAQARSIAETIECTPPLRAGASGTNQVPTIVKDGRVRKLTPLECERLQGFPDGWTDVIFRGKPAADAHRYRALGNSMAVPVMRWIGRRMQLAEVAVERLRGAAKRRCV